MQRPEGGCVMKITYDAEVDALYIQFLETTVTTEHWQKELRPAMMLRGGWPVSRF
jgi:hypothetical protein